MTSPRHTEGATYSCAACGGSGWIGGPSYYQPDEGGYACPDCEAERETFETWAADQGFVLTRTVHGDAYQDLRTQGPWDAWQARATLSAITPESAPEALADAGGITGGSGEVAEALAREAFEKFMSHSRRNRGVKKAEQLLYRFADGTYINEHVQRHWWTWQQARAISHADIQSIRHTLMTGLAHNEAIAALDRFTPPAPNQGAES